MLMTMMVIVMKKHSNFQMPPQTFEHAVVMMYFESTLEDMKESV